MLADHYDTLKHCFFPIQLAPSAIKQVPGIVNTNHLANVSEPPQPMLSQQPQLPQASAAEPLTANRPTTNPFTLAKQVKMPDGKKHLITGKVVHYIVKGLRPYSIVDDPHFKPMVQALNQGTSFLGGMTSVSTSSPPCTTPHCQISSRNCQAWMLLPSQVMGGPCAQQTNITPSLPITWSTGRNGVQG